MNVSTQSDEAFMAALEIEEPKRFENLRRNMLRQGAAVMSESEALTNFILGLSTANVKFGIVAGKGSFVLPERTEADQLLREGTAEEYAAAIVRLAHAPERPLEAMPPSVQPALPVAKKHAGGRPRIYGSAAARVQAHRSRRQHSM